MHEQFCTILNPHIFLGEVIGYHFYESTAKGFLKRVIASCVYIWETCTAHLAFPSGTAEPCIVESCTAESCCLGWRSLAQLNLALVSVAQLSLALLSLAWLSLALVKQKFLWMSVSASCALVVYAETLALGKVAMQLPTATA